MLFVLFFVCNGFSVVLGDKEHHAITLHLMQLCYFSVFYCISYVDEIVQKAYFSFSGQKLGNRQERNTALLRFGLCTAFSA